MSLLNDIRATLASTAPGYRALIPNLPATESAWVLREDSQTCSVFFCLPLSMVALKINEEFANIKLYNLEQHISGSQINSLVLHCLDHSKREQFALICEDFINPAKRAEISADPYEWWKSWSELLGNSSSDASPHSVLGELLVWRRMFNSGVTMSWSGPDGSTHDLIGDVFDIEVKSTTQRYGKRITISGEHQLHVAQGKKLYLAFMRFEQSIGGECVNGVKSDLLSHGVNTTSLEKDLDHLGMPIGRHAREISYMLHDAEIYEVSSSFPKIVPSSFSGGVIPNGIEKIKYEVDLSLLTPISSLDSFVP
jgi:hypothetical protein